MSKDHHAPDVKIYLRVFAALSCLTVLTVFVSYLHLPMTAAILVALVIASVKAGLVAAFFMHLRGERALIYGLLAVTAFFTLVLFVLPLSDSTVTRTSPAASVGYGGPPAVSMVEEHHEP